MFFSCSKYVYTHSEQSSMLLIALIVGKLFLYTISNSTILYLSSTDSSSAFCNYTNKSNASFVWVSLKYFIVIFISVQIIFVRKNIPILFFNCSSSDNYLVWRAGSTGVFSLLLFQTLNTSLMQPVITLALPAPPLMS